MLLEEIHSPSDIKKLSLQELTVLAAEMREEIIKQWRATAGTSLPTWGW